MSDHTHPCCRGRPGRPGLSPLGLTLSLHTTSTSVCRVGLTVANVLDRPRTYAELFGRTHLGAIQGSAQSVNILGTGLGPFILGQGCEMLCYPLSTGVNACPALRHGARGFDTRFRLLLL